jgi:hypothetical protein
MLFHVAVEEDTDLTSFKVDSALGSVVIQSASPLGSEKTGAPGPELLQGSQVARGVRPLDEGRLTAAGQPASSNSPARGVLPVA